MNCKLFTDLSEMDRKQYETELLHAVRSSNWGYIAGKEIIDMANFQGKFLGIKIGHEYLKDDIGIDRNGYETT